MVSSEVLIRNSIVTYRWNSPVFAQFSPFAQSHVVRNFSTSWANTDSRDSDRDWGVRSCLKTHLHADRRRGGWLEDAFEWLKAAAEEIFILIRYGHLRSLFQLVIGKIHALFAERPTLGVLIAAIMAAAAVFFVVRRWGRFSRRTKVKGGKIESLPDDLVEGMALLEKEWTRQGFPRPSWRAPLEHVEALSAEILSLRPSSRHVRNPWSDFLAGNPHRGDEATYGDYSKLVSLSVTWKSYSGYS